MIQVVRPFLPPSSEYEELIRGIWDRNILTNNGPLVKEFEIKIKEYLNLSGFLFVNNGTMAIQMGIRALELKGEIITTPFSYVASTSSLVWERCSPVFADIDPETFNIDPKNIISLITKNTSAILATHVFGNPCEVKKLEEIAEKYNLKLIYDAAHAFGVEIGGKSIFEYGDISTCSFHATKIFHTVEGGGLVCRDPKLLNDLSYIRNFGHDGPGSFKGLGINGKNSEFHAAMGLCNLKYFHNIKKIRKTQFGRYLDGIENLSLSSIKINPDCEHYNYSYFPVLFKNEGDLLSASRILENNQIYPRRYFYPSLSRLPYVRKQELPIGEDISRRVLCLPLFHSMTILDQEKILTLISEGLKD